MTPEKWKQVKTIFDRAVELSTGERPTFLDSVTDAEVRSEVGRMLAADPIDLYELSPARSHEARPEKPVCIGRYRIVSEIGRGGMGAVYLAERDDGEFTQRAALKVIKRGMDTEEIVRRFRAERQILAGLHHAHIARLLDGGTTGDGLPYYAMEYVDGSPIDAYRAERDLNIKETLELFRKVCSAVSHAHQNLIVHRDLKPGNILVTKDGEPKLLDFGIAKILASADGLETATQIGMMTPAYASPEQIRGGPITTASDVYGLGVILFELLTGSRPYETEGKTFAEAMEIVCGTEPRRPSETVGRAKMAEAGDAPGGRARVPQLKGDLDNITLKALQKDPARRYQSVHEFSEDIRRHLEGLPISARADSAGYRFGRFVRRNKILVTSGFLVFASMCAGVAVSLWQASRAEQQRAFAEKRFVEVRELANNVVFKYHDAIAELPGSTGVREMLVRDALRYLDALAADASGDRELQVELGRAYLKLADAQGKIYQANIGDTEGAVASYRKAVGLLEVAVEAAPEDAEAKQALIKAYDSLAFVLTRANGGLEPRGLVEKAIAQYESLPPERADKVQLAELLIRVGDLADGLDKNLEGHLRALPIAEELVAADPDNIEILRVYIRVNQRICTDHQRLGQRSRERGDEEKAARHFRESLVYGRRMFEATGKINRIEPGKPANERYLALASVNFAPALSAAGDHAEALRLLEEAERIVKATLKLDEKNREARFDLMVVYEMKGAVRSEAGDPKAAAADVARALSLAEEISRADPQNAEVKKNIDHNRKFLERLTAGRSGS